MHSWNVWRWLATQKIRIRPSVSQSATALPSSLLMMDPGCLYHWGPQRFLRQPQTPCSCHSRGPRSVCWHGPQWPTPKRTPNANSYHCYGPLGEGDATVPLPPKWAAVVTLLYPALHSHWTQGPWLLCMYLSLVTRPTVTVGWPVPRVSSGPQLCGSSVCAHTGETRVTNVAGVPTPWTLEPSSLCSDPHLGPWLHSHSVSTCA